MGNESRNGKKDLNHNDSGLTGSNLLTNQEEEQKIYLNTIDHHGRLYWIQDDTDGMCVGPYGMAPCGESNLWGIRNNNYWYLSNSWQNQIQHQKRTTSHKPQEHSSKRNKIKDKGNREEKIHHFQTSKDNSNN